MAPVTRSRDRGQLILVAGLTVAVVLVMLVLLLNTVIYTENLATRGIDSGAGDAIEYRATVVGSVEELIDRENEHYDEGHPPIVAVHAGLDVIDEHLRERSLRRGTIAEVDYVEEEDIKEGDPIVWQVDSREFTDGTIITAASDIERFTLTVDPDGFTEGNEEGFSIVVGDWSMEITVEFGEEAEERIEVTVNTEEGDETTYWYDYEEAPLHVDLVDGSIETGDETVSDDIDIPTPDSDEIRFESGDRATGTYELHANGTPDEDNLTEYGDGSGEGPYYTYPVESVDLTLHYETTELRFVTEETIGASEVEP